MTFIVPLLTAVAALLVGIAVARLWYLKVQAPKHARRIGIEALGARHWRDTLGRLVEALGQQGLVAGNELSDGQGAPREERLLRRGNETVLLVYKHGTSYRIGSPALLDAEKRRQDAGIDQVMLATLGTVDAEARAQAARMKITCLDGPQVWALVAPGLDATTRSGVDTEANELAKGGLRLAQIGAAAAALGVFFWSGGADLAEPSTATAGALPAPTPATASTAMPSVAPPSPPKSVEPATAPPPALPPGQARADLAKAVGALPGIERASWSSDSTLVLSLRRRSSVEDAVKRTCALAPDFELLAEVRLQLEAEGDIRWRRCG